MKKKTKKVEYPILTGLKVPIQTDKEISYVKWDDLKVALEAAEKMKPGAKDLIDEVLYGQTSWPEGMYVYDVEKAFNFALKGVPFVWD